MSKMFAYSGCRLILRARSRYFSVSLAMNWASCCGEPPNGTMYSQLPAFQQRWRLQRFDGSAMKFFHDGWRRTARRHQRKPVTVHETRQTAFAHRRQVGHRVEAFVRKHRQSLELPGADEIDHGLGDENEY